MSQGLPLAEAEPTISNSTAAEAAKGRNLTSSDYAEDPPTGPVCSGCCERTLAHVGGSRAWLLARAARRWNARLSTDGAGRAERDLAMAWDRSTEIAARIHPDRVSGSLATLLAAVVAEVTHEVGPLQAAASSIVTCSAWPPPIGGSRPSSR